MVEIGKFSDLLANSWKMSIKWAKKAPISKVPTGSQSEIVTPFPFFQNMAIVEKCFLFLKLLAFGYLWDTLSYVILYNSIILCVSWPQYELFLPAFFEV